MVIERLKAMAFDRVLTTETRQVLRDISSGHFEKASIEAKQLLDVAAMPGRKAALSRFVVRSVLAEAARRDGVEHDDLLAGMQEDLIAATPPGYEATELSLADRLYRESLAEGVVMVCRDLLERHKSSRLVTHPNFALRIRTLMERCQKAL